MIGEFAQANNFLGPSLEVILPLLCEIINAELDQSTNEGGFLGRRDLRYRSLINLFADVGGLQSRAEVLEQGLIK